MAKGDADACCTNYQQIKNHFIDNCIAQNQSKEKQI